MKRQRGIQTPKKSQGFTLLELLLVISISMGISIVAFQEKKLELEQFQARRLGMELYQFNSGLQNYLSNMSGSTNPGSLAGTKTGVNWLKSASCGGSGTRDWVPCNFLVSNNQKTSFGDLGFTTTIAYDTQRGLHSRTQMSKLQVGIAGSLKERGDLSGLAALVASGAYTLGDQGAQREGSAQGNEIVYCPDIAISSSNPTCGSAKGVIVMESQNLSEADRWIRSDHGNTMKGALEFAQSNTDLPATDAQLSAIDSVGRQIRNVARIYNLGSSGNDALILGKKNGANALSIATLKTNSVVVDADSEVLGQLKVQSGITAGGDINANANLSVSGVTTANGALNAKSTLDVQGKTTAVGGIQSNQLIKGLTDLDIARDANIGGKLTTSNAQVNGTLTGNAISANTIYGNDLSANQLTTNGTTRLNGTNVLSGNTYAYRIMDADNSGYYLDMNNNSMFNGVLANGIVSYGGITSNGRMTANEYLYIGGGAAEGTGCGPNGLVGRNGAGALLSCVNGVWASGSSMPKWRAAGVAVNGNYCRIYKSTADTDMYVNNQPIGANANSRLNSSYFIPLSNNTTLTLERSYYTVDMGSNNNRVVTYYNQIRAYVYDAYVDIERGYNASISDSANCPTAYVR